MRLLVVFLLLIPPVLFSCTKKKAPYDPLDATIQSEQAQNDFETFRGILERGHPALRQYMTAREKDRCLDSLYETIGKEITLRDFYKKISFFLDKVGCSHTIGLLPAQTWDSLYERKLFFPFTTILLEEGLYVNGDDDDMTRGAQILSVNNVPIDKIMDSLLIYNVAEGYNRRSKRYAAAIDFSIDYYTHYGCPKEFRIGIKDTSGKIKTVVYEPVSLNEFLDRRSNRYYYDATDVPYSLSVYNEYAVIRLSTFEFNSNNQQLAFEEFVKNTFELLSLKKNIKSLVIDLRENTGGTLYNCFLLHSYLAKAPFKEYRRVFSVSKKVMSEEYLSAGADNDDLDGINDRLSGEFIGRTKTGYFIPDSLIEEWQPDPKRFTGNTYIITNHEVASAASYFAMLSRNNGNAKIVGTETCGGGYSGNGFKTLEYELPATHIRFQFPYAKMFYSYYEKNKGTGLLPDYEVPDNYEYFITNDDRQRLYIKDSLLVKNK